MSYGCAFLGILALSSLAGLPGLAQTSLDKAVVLKVTRPLDASQATRPNQLYITQVVSSQDPNLPEGSMLGVQISGGGIHAVNARTPNGMAHFTSPAATSSAGTASGSAISVPAGEFICFNVPGKCGATANAAAAPSPAPMKSAASPMTAASASTTDGQYPFTLEGIGLRMPLDQVRAAAKAAGSVKGLKQQGPTTYNVDTKDLSFQIELTAAGLVRQYNVSDASAKHAPETGTSGPLYDKLVKAFGPKSSWPSGAVNYDAGSGSAYAIVTDLSAQ